MSHKEFVLAYEKGSLGCGVSALLTLRLFLAGNIREKVISINLLFWALSFLVLMVASVIGFLILPVYWAMLCATIGLVIYALIFFYRVGDLVLSTALASEDFYEYAKAKRALRIFPR